MRFAFVVSSGLGYYIPNLFQTDSSFGEFDDALHCLARYGFTGVELNLASAEEHVLSRIHESINERGLQLAAVGTGLLYVKNGLSFTEPDGARREKAVQVVKELLHFASREGAILVIGLVRGVASSGMEAAGDLLREALVDCDQAATELGAYIALEAINRYETPLLNTAEEVAALIDEEGLNATGILLDTFHMNIEEPSIQETISKCRSKIAHFHIADSNRWPPGHGHLKVEQALSALEELEYDGWVSAETLPKPSNASAVADTAQFLRNHNFIRP
jgi:sugar phosphate isomerase/epimerase